MDPLADDLEQAAEIAAVERALTEEYPNDSGPLAAFEGRLVDGTPVRLFALRRPGEGAVRAAFETVRSEWEAAGERSGVTAVLARGDEPVPWLAVEQPSGQRYRDVGPALSGPERWRVLTEVAETLRSVGTPHLACHPGRIWIERDDGPTARLDWAIDRVRLRAASNGDGSGNESGEADVPEDLRPYVAPEVQRDPAAGDGRSDVYALGMLARYGRTGEESPVEGPNSHRPGVTAPESPVKAWVANRATNSDPDRRFDSPYAFKRAALFGPSAQPDPPEDRTGVGVSGGRLGGTEYRGGDAGRERAPPTGGDEPERESGAGDSGSDDSGSGDSSTGVLGKTETPLGRISRRQAVGLTAGAALAGFVALFGDWSDPDSNTGGGVSGGSPEMSVAFDAGILTLTNTGTVPLETASLVLSGAGFVTTPEQRVAGYVDAEELEPGATVRIPADPAYELDVYYDRGDETVDLVRSEGPAAGERDPGPGPLYVPEMGFLLERRDGRLQVEYEGEPTVPANHVRFVGAGFGGAPNERWNDRLGIGSDDAVTPGDFTRYRVTTEAVLRVEWAPPYLAASTTIAQYEGENRPLDEDRGGVAGPRYDAGNTGSAPSGTEIAGQPTEAWSTELDNEARGSLAVGSGRVFASTGRHLYALDAADGEILWRRYIASGRAFDPVVDGETVYLGTSGFGPESRLLAFDVADGAEKWEFTASTPGLRSPTVSDGIVFTAGTSSASEVYVVDPDDGSGDSIEEAGPQVGRAAFDGRRLYLRTVTGGITAVGPREIDWSYPADGDLSPVVAGETVYGVDDGADGSGGLFAVDARDGSEKWTADVGGDLRVPLAVGAGTVVAGTADGVVAAVDAESGERQWWADPSLRIGRGIVTTGESVYVTGLQTVTALSIEDGRPRWSLEIGPLIGTEPAVSGDCLYLGSSAAVSAFCAPPASQTD